MEYVFVLLFLVPSIILTRQFLLFNKIGDAEIINIIGNHWKDVSRIKEELIAEYSTQWGGPRPYPDESFLRKRLYKLCKKGLLIQRRFVYYENGRRKKRFEYRKNIARLPRTGKRNPFFKTRLALEGV